MYSSTFEIPIPPSAAVVTTVDIPETVEPEVGSVMEIVGAVVSFTVTVKLAEPVLPAASLAVQLTVVVPIGNVEAEAGLHVTGREPSTKSVAVAVNVTAAPAELVASTIISAGTVTVGEVVS